MAETRRTGQHNYTNTIGEFFAQARRLRPSPNPRLRYDVQRAARRSTRGKRQRQATKGRTGSSPAAGQPPRRPPRAPVGRSDRPAFVRRRARSGRRCGTDQQTRVAASRGVSVQIGPAPHLAICAAGPVAGFRRRDRPVCGPWSAAVAGFGGVLAGDPIRGDLQAHLALAGVAKQPPSSTPTWLLVRTRGISSPTGATAPGSPRECGRAVPRHWFHATSGDADRSPSVARQVRLGRRSGPPGRHRSCEVLEIRASEVSRGAAWGVSLAATMQDCSAVLLPMGRVWRCEWLVAQLDGL